MRHDMMLWEVLKEIAEGSNAEYEAANGDKVSKGTLDDYLRFNVREGVMFRKAGEVKPDAEVVAKYIAMVDKRKERLLEEIKHESMTAAVDSVGSERLKTVIRKFHGTDYHAVIRAKNDGVHCSDELREAWNDDNDIAGWVMMEKGLEIVTKELKERGVGDPVRTANTIMLELKSVDDRLKSGTGGRGMERLRLMQSLTRLALSTLTYEREAYQNVR